MNVQPLTPTEVLQIKKKAFLGKRSLKRLVIALAAAAIAAFTVFGAVYGIAGVRGNSMYPAIDAGDWIVFSRTGTYQRGDIVIFHADERYGDDYIKRIAGLPGETVDIDETGRVLIDGRAIEEPYAMGATMRKEGGAYPETLKSDEYYVLGDNRENSLDSRNYGAVSKNRILGKVEMTIRF